MDVLDYFGDGENVYLRGFGSFIVKHRAKKVANISKGISIEVAAHNIYGIQAFEGIAAKVITFKNMNDICQAVKKRKRHKMSTHKRKKD